MKKNKILITIFTILMTISFGIEVNADEISKDDIAAGTYVIGNSLYNRNDGAEYDGILTIQHIMLASKTLKSNQISDMKIYYKNSRGNWVDPITNELVDVDNNFTIIYINNNLTDIIYGDINKDEKVNAKDMIILQKCVNGTHEIDEYIKIVGDLDSNGVINSIDVDIFSKYLTGIDQYKELPVDLESIITYGDANGDSLVDAKDLSIILENVKKEATINKVEHLQMDLNNDEVIDINDITILQKHLIGVSGYEKLPILNTEENVTYGDINKDGTINTKDIIILQKCINGTYEIDEYIKISGDLDLNGVIDNTDLDIIMKHLSEFEEYKELPVDLNSVLKYGDINNDNIIDYQDLQLLARRVFGGEKIYGLGELAADVNLDNEINNLDVMILHNYLQGFHREIYNKLGFKYNNFTGATYTGDIKVDGVTDELDVEAIKEYVNGNDILPGALLMEADINLDGIVNMTDALILSLHIDNVSGFENLYAININEVIKYGDLNNDGVIDNDDTSIIMNYLVGSIELTPLQLLAADVYYDGKINTKDLIVINKHIAGESNYQNLPYDTLNN